MEITEERKQSLDELIERVLLWAEDRQILTKATKFKQAQKSLEEVGELIHAIGESNHDEVKDAIGDIFVTIIIQAEMNGLDIRDCLKSAYDVIKNRTGVMISGSFIKDL